MQLRSLVLALSAAFALKHTVQRVGLEDQLVDSAATGLDASLAAAEAAASAELAVLSAVAGSSAAEAAEADRADTSFLRSAWGCLVQELQELQNTSLPTGNVERRKDTIVADKLSAVNAASKDLTGKAMLMPALGMLNGMYEEQKERIGELNKKEQRSKERFANQTKRHELAMEHYKELLDHHKISQGFYVNATNEENWQYDYMVRCRNRAHKSFHTQLKLTHGLMEKEKGMVSAYNTALAAPAPGTKVQAAQPQAVPEIVLLQGRQLAEYCQEAMSTARSEMTSMEEPLASK